MSETVSKMGPSRAQWLRRLAQRRRGQTALVLSGGGPLGALQVGAARALMEHGVRPDMIVGTSVGALNGAFLASTPGLEGVENLESTWRSMIDADMFPGARWRASWARFLAKGDHVFEHSGIRQLLEQRIGDTRIEETPTRLGIVATELLTGAERLFTSGRLVEVLLASTAMPGIYAPVPIDGTRYIDGGVANNVPVAPAIDMGASTIYVLNTTSQGSGQQRPMNRPMDYLLHAFALARSQRLAIEQAVYANKVKLVMLPAPQLDVYVSFATLAHTDMLIEKGYASASRFLSGASGAEVSSYNQGALEAIVPAK